MFCALMSVTKHWDPNPDTKLTRVQNQAGEGGGNAGFTMDANVNKTASGRLGVFPMLLNEQLLPI